MTSWRHLSRMTTSGGSASRCPNLRRNDISPHAVPVDFSGRWSDQAQRLQPAALAELIDRFASVPGAMSMAGGLPAAETFPLTHVQSTDRLGASIPLDAAQLYAAQQYCFSPCGYVPLVKWLQHLVQQQHAPQLPVDLVVTAGAVHGLHMIFSCLINPGDAVVLDEFTYSHAVDCIFVPRGVRMLPVAMDHEGMRVDSLRHVLTAHQCQAGACPVRALYLVPNGQNPTSAVMSIARKRDILKVAQEFDLIIVEDDAYYWLNYASRQQDSSTLSTSASTSAVSSSPSAGTSGISSDSSSNSSSDRSSSSSGTASSSGASADSSSSTSSRGSASSIPAAGQAIAPAGLMPGLSGLPPSLLSMDMEGRVVRVDTFAKLLGPGYRLGWVTGAPSLVSKVSLAVMGSMVGAPTFTQVMVHSLLTAWGLNGFEDFVSGVQAMYGRRAAAAEVSARLHLRGVASWQPLSAGMFMWLRLTTVDDVDEPLLAALIKHKLVVVPGRMCWSDHAALASGAACPYLRLSIASLDEQQMDEAFRRLRAALDEAAGR